MRLARYLAKAGVASRRKSEALIEAGRVTVNGKCITTPAFNVDPHGDTITFDGRSLSLEHHVYYLLHKPAGYTCSASDPHADKLAIELLNLPGEPRVFSVGRLDRDSEGLLLFTNDGKLSHRLLHPSFEVPKAYHVRVTGETAKANLSRLIAGIDDDGERLVAQQARWRQQKPSSGELEIIVNEGKKREVRRLCAALDLKVERLIRVRFGPLLLGNLPAGAYRELLPDELQALRNASD